ncbi:MAG: glycogen debranching N-terminal domain-containing protein [Patescibacteria group bacterium]
MSSTELQLCRGLRFSVTDEIGNINEPTQQGLYFKDTRHLRYYRLLIDNTIPHSLTSKKTAYNSATAVLTNPRTEHLHYNMISIVRTQTLEVGLLDRIEIINNTEEHLSFPVELQFNADFADLFEIKHLYLEKGNRPIKKRKINKKVSRKKKQVRLRYERDDFHKNTCLVFDQEGMIKPDTAQFDVNLEPKLSWILNVALLFDEPKAGETAVTAPSEPFPVERFDAPHIAPPNLETDWHDLARAYDVSLHDLAALRIHAKIIKNKSANVPAAGLPWFMTVFGRDSLITAFQTLMLGSDISLGVIDTLAQFQGTEVNHLKEEEPGKILHEIRFGEIAHFKEWVQFPYYATADSTPLFLILLSEMFRWSTDHEHIREHRTHVEQALNWIDAYGDMDGDGFVEYHKKTPGGLDNQNWRDSWDSMSFHDGSLAESPIASADVQGYVYDAKLRMAELARTVWEDESWATRLEEQAASLKKKFNAAFWISDRGFFALGLDRDKKPIDAISSSLGHLLWSGIVDKKHTTAVVEHLMNQNLYSGWGVRTYEHSAKAFNPVGYHLGTVWPHDNSLIAAGLYKCGYQQEAMRIVEDMLKASSYFDHRLPEVFAGYDRSLTPFPVQYPTSSSPQAWAAGTTILFLQIALGITPDYEKKRLTIHPMLPHNVNYIRLDGVSAFGKHYLIEVTKTRSTIREVKEYTSYWEKDMVKVE